MEKTRQPDARLIFCSPFRGVVQEVPARQGAGIKAGDRLVDVADLSQVWVWADVYEDELGGLRAGQKATVTANGMPGRAFGGNIAVISSSVDEATRTARARIEVNNSDFALHPGMDVNVELERDGGEGLAVPVGAIIPTGLRNIAFVDRGEGRLSPRAVRLGGKFGDYYEVLDGIERGRARGLQREFPDRRGIQGARRA